MFSQLTERLSTSLQKLRGVKQFSESNIQEAIADIRKALIEADVALPVVKTFIDAVTQKAIGQTIVKQVRATDAFIKLVQDELIHVLGDESSDINLRAQKPVIIVMAVFKGCGKTNPTPQPPPSFSSTHK